MAYNTGVSQNERRNSSLFFVASVVCFLCSIQVLTSAVTVWATRRSGARLRPQLQNKPSEIAPTHWAKSLPCPSSGTSTRTWRGRWRWGPSAAPHTVSPIRLKHRLMLWLIWWTVAGERALRIRVAEVSGKCSGGVWLFCFCVCVWPHHRVSWEQMSNISK